MAIATLTNIEKTYGQRVLFDKLNLSIDRGERVGLVGDNGSGKTSIFNVLTGKMAIDDGQCSIAKGISLGHLTQNPEFDPANTVIDEAELAFADLHRLSMRLRQMEHDMGSHTGKELEKTLAKYQDVQHQFDLAGGYAWQHRLEAALLGVGLDRALWEQNVETLSGGQRSRLALAKLLVEQNDLLLLDEPTNHLDLTAIAWLENFLATFSGSVLVISHDRYLLDRLATRIVWLTDAKLNSYPGNYSAFVQQRQLHELSRQRAYEEQQEFIDKQSEYIRRFGANQRARQAAGRKKRLESLLTSDALIKAVQSDKKINVRLQTDQRAGDRVLSVKDLSKSYDRPLWKNISLELKRGELVGIIGPNGSGKTTLLEVLLGLRDADGGEIRWGANLNIGYYDQNVDEFDPENTVAEEVRGEREVSHQQLRQALGLMLFHGESVNRPMKLLSGGERARVAIARLLLDRPNVLVLDEPTNHLDINSCEALERALTDYPGTIFCVSHDRYFLDRVIKRLIVLEPPNASDFMGNYSAWVKRPAPQEATKPAATKQAKPKTEPKPRPAAKVDKPAKTAKGDNPWKRPFGRLSVEELESQIQVTESALAECQGKFASAEVVREADRSRELKDRYDYLTNKLKQLEEEYFTRQK